MWHDIVYAFRTLRRQPGLTAMAVLALAIAVGANTAIFSVVNAVLLRPLPFHDPDHLVFLWEANPIIGGLLSERLPVCLKNYLRWKAQARSFESMGAMVATKVDLTGGDKPERIEAARASADFFSVLGVHPAAGRFFTPDEGAPGKDRLAILSYGLWMRRFGNDPAVLQRTITLDGVD